ncbi:MAG: hypothetical protein SFX19_09995 [Alphaproteobacteria bacterium]|nr:hypothetical protein [Alphaproteobacteria bacterium]
MTKQSFNKKTQLENLKAALRQAFFDDALEMISIDGWASWEKRKALNMAVKKGWLKEEQPTEEEQYTALNFSLTSKGRKAIAA